MYEAIGAPGRARRLAPGRYGTVSSMNAFRRCTMNDSDSAVRPTCSAGSGLVPLGKLLERTFREAGLQWPPAVACTLTQPRGLESGADAYLTLLASSGGRGEASGQFSDPFFAIPLPDGNVCVSDYGNHRLQIVSARGEALQSLCHRGRRAGELTRPLGLALDSQGLFVADDADRVQKFDHDGHPLRSFWQGTRDSTGDSATERLAAEWARLRQPYGVALGPDGRVYVSDRSKHRIAVLNKGGDFSFAFGAKGSGFGQLDEPRGIAVHAMQVYVADMCNHRIALFSPDGTPRRPIGSHGDGPGQFRYPVGVALSADLLLVSEYVGRRIHVLSATGACLQLIHAPFGDAYACALASNEHRVVLTDTRCRLHVFDIRRRGPVAFAHTPSPAAPGHRDPHNGALPTELPSESAARGGGSSGPFGTQAGSACLAAPGSSSMAGGPAKRARRETRRERIEAALEATDFRGVLDQLTQEDVHVLVPRAYAHAELHPELYQLPPPQEAWRETADT